MGKRYVLWDKTSDIYTPAGPVLTAAQWMEQYGWLKNPSTVAVVSAGNINGAFIGELGQMRAQYQRMGCEFTDDMTNEQVLDAIEVFEDQREESAKAAREEAANTPSAEERIAAALEFQNLTNL